MKIMQADSQNSFKVRDKLDLPTPDLPNMKAKPRFSLEVPQSITSPENCKIREIDLNRFKGMLLSHQQSFRRSGKQRLISIRLRVRSGPLAFLRSSLILFFFIFLTNSAQTLVSQLLVEAIFSSTFVPRIYKILTVLISIISFTFVPQYVLR